MTPAVQIAKEPLTTVQRVKAALRERLDAVSRDDYLALEQLLAEIVLQRNEARKEVAQLAKELTAEIENGQRLTNLAARAVQSVQKIRQAFTEYQIGEAAQGDPTQVLVANLPPPKKKQRGFIPLGRRKQLARRKEQDEQTRRNALPKIKADLPELPLTAEDEALMSEAIAEISHDIIPA